MIKYREDNDPVDYHFRKVSIKCCYMCGFYSAAAGCKHKVADLTDRTPTDVVCDLWVYNTEKPKPPENITVTETFKDIKKPEPLKPVYIKEGVRGYVDKPKKEKF